MNGLAAPWAHQTEFRWLDVRQSEVERLRHEVSMSGFGHLEQALTPAALERLRKEAAVAISSVQLAEQSETLSYRARIGSCGQQTMAFLSGAEAESLLNAVFGRQFALAQEVSCITFYGAGDHLGPHLDKPADRCAVTILVYLDAISLKPEALDSGLNLRIYGQTFELSQSATKIIPTRAGTIVLGYGARYWHERPPLRSGESVVAITGCYAPGADDPIQA